MSPPVPSPAASGLVRRASWLVGAGAAGLLIGSAATALANTSTQLLGGSLMPADGAAAANPEEELIVQMTFGRFLLADAVIAYPTGSGLLLPLDTLFRAVDFAITVEADVGRAQGWFLHESRSFELDMASGEVIVEGRRRTWPPGAVQVLDGEMYVAAPLLAEWFPLQFAFDSSSLVVDVSARERMPFEAALERQQMRGRRREAEVDTSVSLPRVSPDYAFASWPMADISIDGDAVQHGARQARASALVTGDLLFAGASGFASFDDRGRLQDPRLRLERRDEEGYALGFKGVTGAAVGDTFTRNVPLIAAGSNGLGLSLTNQPLNRLSDLDRVTMRGNVTPGWDVELYRNGSLFDFAQATSDGRYEFTDVPLLPGVNDMLVVLLGPQGQRREVAERYYAGPGLITPGQQYYDVFIGQHEQRLFRSGEETERDQQGTGKDRWLASVETGITPNLSVATSFARLPVGDKVRDFGMVGLRGQLGGLFGRLDVAYDDRGGIGAEVSALTRIGETSFSLRQGWFSGFESEDTLRSGPGLKLRTEARVEQPMQLGKLPPINGTYQLRYDSLASRQQRATVSARHALFVLPFAFSHTLDAQVNAGAPVAVRGNLLASARLRARDLVRTNVTYSVGPRPRIDSVTAGWQRQVGLNTQLRADASQSIGGDRSTSVVGGISQRFRQMLVSSFAGYGSGQGMLAGISTFFSFGRGPSGGPVMRADSMASGGVVGARAFLDNDSDGRFSKGDAPLENVGFSGSARTIRTRADGYALLPGASAYQSAALRLDESTLDDPYWVAAVPGYRAVARPGRVTVLDFPVTPTGEVQGTVYLRKGDAKTAVSNVRMMLITATGRVQAEVKTDYDGYYLFERVPPGDYRVTIDPDQMIRQRLVIGEPKAVLLKPGQTNDIRGIDLVIERLPFEEARVSPESTLLGAPSADALPGAFTQRVHP
ncbi:hypothetical protein [Nevskia sp.]|uniref:MSCRAMM family protein n=1 Tax=Nevskia sp. TaxID=1929292 RepID=UPI003F6EDD12